jgi:hypothetical protein
MTVSVKGKVMPDLVFNTFTAFRLEFTHVQARENNVKVSIFARMTATLAQHDHSVFRFFPFLCSRASPASQIAENSTKPRLVLMAPV